MTGLLEIMKVFKRVWNFRFLKLCIITMVSLLYILKYCSHGFDVCKLLMLNIQCFLWCSCWKTVKGFCVLLPLVACSSWGKLGNLCLSLKIFISVAFGIFVYTKKEHFKDSKWFCGIWGVSINCPGFNLKH